MSLGSSAVTDGGGFSGWESGHCEKTNLTNNNLSLQVLHINLKSEKILEQSARTKVQPLLCMCCCKP